MTALILLAALVLRVWGLGFGLPDLFHQDEPILVNHALAIGAGGWNPHFFILPPFCMYSLFAVYAAVFLFLKLAGVVSSPAAYAALFLKDPTFFYWAARFFLGVLPGVATVWLVCRQGQKLYSKSIGRTAGLLLALLPLHVRHSHYAYTDGWVTFALTLFWFELIRLARQEGGRKAYARAGAVLGWAVAVKYTAAYSILAFAAAVWAREKGRLLSSRALGGMVLFGLSSLAVFAAIAPYTFLDWSTFLSQIRHQASAESALPIAHHLIYSLIGGSGALFMALALAGVQPLFKRASGEAWVSVIFVSVFYAVNTLFGQHYARYVLPLFPLLVVTAALALDSIAVLAGKRLMGWVMGGVCAAFLISVCYSNFLFSRPDTRTQCREWLEKHAAQGDVIVLTSRTFGPRLVQTSDQIRAKAARLSDSAVDVVRGRRLQLEADALAGKKSFEVYTLPAALAGKAFMAEEPQVQADAGKLRGIGPDYLVVHSGDPNPAVEKMLAALSGELKKAAVFSPYRDAERRQSQDPYGSTAAPDDPREIFSRTALGPYLEVYVFEKAGKV